MKITKRPKRTKVKYEKVYSEIASYECPTCRVQYVGGGPGRSVTRFVCKCGQELIVE